MTELQKCEFEMLKTVVEVCDLLEIKYFLVCGSALGAAKYGGFIPWDDDVDVGMYREDYEKFIKEAQKHLPSHLIIQNNKTEPNHTLVFSKLRNSNTTYIEQGSKHLDINHGIFLDIFPLDGYPQNEKEQKRLEVKKSRYVFLLESNYNFKRGRKAQFITTILRFFGIAGFYGNIVKKYEKLISSYPVESSDYVCNHGNWQGKKEYAPKSQYGNGTWKTFEGLRVRVPENYDEYLTQKYGDWRSDPPIECQQGHHYYEFLDVDKSYVHYIQKHK